MLTELRTQVPIRRLIWDCYFSGDTSKWRLSTANCIKFADVCRRERVPRIVGDMDEDAGHSFICNIIVILYLH